MYGKNLDKKTVFGGRSSLVAPVLFHSLLVFGTGAPIVWE